jgi:hypothetical protein
VCTRAQTVAAVISSMDTCVGGKQTDESEPARMLQRVFLASVEQHAGRAALYANARCILAELQQDEALEAARLAKSAGRQVLEARLMRLQAPFEQMLSCISQDGGCMEAVAGVGAGSTHQGAGGAETRAHVEQGLTQRCWKAHNGDTRVDGGVAHEPRAAKGGQPGDHDCIYQGPEGEVWETAARREPGTTTAVEETIKETPIEEPQAPSLCPLILGTSLPLQREAVQERHRWYPFWFLGASLMDTAEVLVEEFSGVLEPGAAEAEAHGLCLHALHALAAGPLHRYQCAPAGPDVYFASSSRGKAASTQTMPSTTRDSHQFGDEP